MTREEALETLRFAKKNGVQDTRRVSTALVLLVSELLEDEGPAKQSTADN